MAIKLNRYKIKNPKKILPKNYLVTETRYSNVRTQKVKLCSKIATTKWLGLSNEMSPVSITDILGQRPILLLKCHTEQILQLFRIQFVPFTKSFTILIINLKSCQILHRRIWHPVKHLRWSVFAILIHNF